MATEWPSSTRILLALLGLVFLLRTAPETVIPALRRRPGSDLVALRLLRLRFGALVCGFALCFGAAFFPGKQVLWVFFALGLAALAAALYFSVRLRRHAQARTFHAT